MLQFLSGKRIRSSAREFPKGKRSHLNLAILGDVMKAIAWINFLKTLSQIFSW
jgi:hypothetical protein